MGGIHSKLVRAWLLDNLLHLKIAVGTLTPAVEATMSTASATKGEEKFECNSLNYQRILIFEPI